MFNKLFRSGRKRRFSNRRNRTLSFESLEDRRLMVVGTFDLATAAVAGLGFDGVVNVSGGSGNWKITICTRTPRRRSRE